MTVVIILAVTLTSGYVMDGLFDAHTRQTPNNLMWTLRYLVDDPMVQLVTFPTAVVNGLAPPVPASHGSLFAARAKKVAAKSGNPIHGRVIPVYLTLRGTHVPWSVRNGIGFALLAALAWVALRDKRLEPASRSLARASLTVIAFNWVLHGFWGGEQFLYSQHWHMSLLVLLAVTVWALEARGRNTLVALVICVLGIAINNSIVLTKTLQVLLED